METLFENRTSTIGRDLKVLAASGMRAG